MNALKFLLRTSWIEFRAGVSSGLVSFTFVGLCLYLVLTLLNAEYMQQLGATDVTRNAATVIYLMVTGFMFFLFFAYAWVFAQPILRDRNADLHEIMLTMPVSLNTLLWGRFIGASLTGTVLASSVLFGFGIAPLLEMAGVLPAGSFSDTPWGLFGFSLLWLIIPTCMGIGAIYMMMTMFTRNLAGPLGAAVVLILMWMFSATILVEGDINTGLADILDPSLFSFALAATDSWTPMQKQSAFLPLSDSFLINRFLWGLLPVLLLAIAMRTVSREHLIANNEKKNATTKQKQIKHKLASAIASGITPSRNWLHAFFHESRWQLQQVINRPAIWVAMLVMLCVGLSNIFIHVIWHAEGPLLPDPGMLQNALGKSLHLVIVFIVAGTVGIICRRDHVAGIDDMLDGLSTPSILRVGARALTVVVVTTLLTVTPAFSAIIATLLANPDYLDIGYAFGMQLLVVLPTQIECALVVFVVHALIRRTGLAYGASMFAMVIIIANHELELINYPPFELSIPARITFSPLTQWVPWLDYVLLLGAFKWLLALLLFGIAIIALPRGKDSRLANLKTINFQQLTRAPAAIVIAAVIGLTTTLSLLNEQLIEKGGYKTVAAERFDNAQWEKIWNDGAKDSDFNVAGGNLTLSVNTAQGYVEGHWVLEQVTATAGVLYAQAPEGMHSFVAKVNGKQIATPIEQELISLPLDNCTDSGCTVTLSWQTQPQGWSTTATIPWITSEGIWAHATQLAPMLGIDADKILRAKLQRQENGLSAEYKLPSWSSSSSADGIAPAGNWAWQVAVVNDNPAYRLHSPLKGETSGPLEVAIFGGKHLQKSVTSDMSVWGSPKDVALNNAIAMDTLEMQQCVERRLQTSIDIMHIVRTPDEASEFSNAVLMLAESPNWHVASDGIGHMMRKAEIARLLARRHILNAYSLRKSSGSILLSEGLPGAIGLLCVADTQGENAFAQVTERYGDATTNAISSSSVPVKSLKDDLSDGWSLHYSPLALLAWTASQTPQELVASLEALNQQQPFATKLNQIFGESNASSLLDVPNATSFEIIEPVNGELTVKGQRRQWLKGGWQPVPASVTARRIVTNKSGTQLSTTNKLDDVTEPTLVIDEWPAYQPSGLSVQRDDQQ